MQFTAKLNFVTASKGMKKEFGHKSRMDGVQASPNNVKHATGITIQASRARRRAPGAHSVQHYGFLSQYFPLASRSIIAFALPSQQSLCTAG